MSFKFLERASAKTIPIVPIETAVFEAWCKSQPKGMRDWVASVGFKANSGETSFVAGANGKLEQVLLGVEAHDGLWAYAGLPTALPPGRYRIDARFEPGEARHGCRAEPSRSRGRGCRYGSAPGVDRQPRQR